MNEDYECLAAIDKLRDVARYIELNYEESGLHVLMRVCADELMSLRNCKKDAKIKTEDLIKKLNPGKIKKL